MIEIYGTGQPGTGNVVTGLWNQLSFLQGALYPLPQFTCVNSHMVLIVGGTREASPAVGLRTNVRPLPCVCPDVDLTDVGGGERAATAFKRAFEGTLTFINKKKKSRVWLLPVRPTFAPHNALEFETVITSPPPCLLHGRVPPFQGLRTFGESSCTVHKNKQKGWAARQTQWLHAFDSSSSHSPQPNA